MGDGGWDLPTDAFAEILVRIPASTRRRLRLVCRHWRGVIDERAPARPSEPKPLAYVIHRPGSIHASGSAYVFDGDPAQGRRREVWRGGPAAAGAAAGGAAFDTRMVGTCSGLLCLCDNTRPGGAISLVNPATGESLALPPLPGSGRWARRSELYRYWKPRDVFTRWHEAYAFVHGPATGRHAVVHLPCYADRTGQFDAVQVFVLGDDAAAWRDMPAMAAPDAPASCRLDAGIVGIGGAAYWVTKGSEMVMSFDAEDERVAPAAALPVAAAAGSGAGSRFHLAEVRGRLGFVVTVDEPKLAKVEVWVLGDGGGRRAWSCRYRVQVHGPPRQQLARPHFEFARGQCVLTNGPENRDNGVFAHRLGGAAGRLQCREVRINERKPGTAVADFSYGNIRTFAYVETTEALSVSLSL